MMPYTSLDQFSETVVSLIVIRNKSANRTSLTKNAAEMLESEPCAQYGVDQAT